MSRKSLEGTIPDPAKPEFEPLPKGAYDRLTLSCSKNSRATAPSALATASSMAAGRTSACRGQKGYLNERKLPRVSRRPKDSLTVEAAAELLPYSRWKIYRAVFAGEIEAVIHSQTIYLDRRSVEAYRLEQKSLLPLPGWILMQDAAQQVGRSYTSLRAWLTLHERPIRVFLHPKSHRPRRYMLRADLEKYRQTAAKTDKHVPKSLRDGDRGSS